MTTTTGPSLNKLLLKEFNKGDVVPFVGDISDGNMSVNSQLTSLLVNDSQAHCDFCSATGRCQRPERCIVPFARAAQIYQITYSRHSLISAVQRQLETACKPTPAHQTIAKLPVRVIVTTAYDDRLLQALTDAGRRVSHVVRDSHIPYDDPDQVQLIRLHGSISQPDSLVLTEDDAADLFRRLPAVAIILQAHFAQNTLLFVGYNLSDPHFLTLYRQVTEPIAPHVPMAFALEWPPNDITPLRWRDKIRIIHQTPDSFLTLLSRSVRLPAAKVHPLPLPSEPYKFLHFFTSSDAEIFHGRGRETERLVSLVLAHPLSILYGESGTGKTSLIQTALVPRLRTKGFSVASVRLISDPIQALKEAILEELDNEHSTLQDELDLSAIITKCLPQDKPLLIVLDQFEEFFIRQGLQTRSHFIDELVKLLNITTREVRFLLALRNEYLDQLDELQLPLGRDPLQYRMRLRNLGAAEASAAISKPASAFKIRLERALLEQLLTDLDQSGIVPSQLQIVCYALWQDWVKRGKPTSGLTRRHYMKLGGTSAILAGYLDNVIKELQQPEVRKVIGLNLDAGTAEEVVRTILKSMITTERTKAAVSQREITRSEILARANIAPAQVEALLDYLTNKRVIRCLPGSGHYTISRTNASSVACQAQDTMNWLTK